MSVLEDAKKTYDQIPIPDELHTRVEAAIRNSQEGIRRERKMVMIRRRNQRFRVGAGAAAAAMAIFTVALNSNAAFAKEMGNIPVIGSVAQILTFRAYEKEEDGIGISVEIPSVSMIAEDTAGAAEAINEEIYNLCSRYADEAVERAKEYRQAFLDTGGTEEEWLAHKIQIKVGYEIKAQTDRYLSFVVTGMENWSSAYSQSVYYTLDLSDASQVTLEELLGEGGFEKADEEIRSQMESMESESGIQFWAEEEGGFSGVTEETKFYVNEKNNPVIVFDKYEIAPGAFGAIEFELER